MYLHYSLLLIVNNYELVIFVSLFKWYKTYTCNYIYLQLYIYFVIVNLLLINIFRIFFLLILLPYIEILAPPLGSSIWNQGMHVRSPSLYKAWCCISGWWHFKREWSYFSWIWVSLSLSLSLWDHVWNNFFFFFFFFFFCLTWFQSWIFFLFWSPIPQKRTDFLDSMWEVPSWYIDSSWSHIQAAIESYLKSFR